MTDTFAASVQCAAWLLLAGFKVSHIEQNGRHRKYYFAHDENLRDYMGMYVNGKFFSPEFAEAVSEIRAAPATIIK